MFDILFYSFQDFVRTTTKVVKINNYKFISSLKVFENKNTLN